MTHPDDTYDYWNAKLRGESPEPLTDRSKAPLGFWRMRGEFDPAVAVWLHDGERVGWQIKQPGTEPVWFKADRLAEMAEQGRFNVAVTKEAHDAYRAGAGWPNMDKTVAKQVAARGKGDNNPPSDPLEILREQIAAAKVGIADYAKITSDEQLERAQGLRNRLTELRGQADKLREERKRPHLEAGKAVDAECMPLVKDANVAAAQVKLAMDNYVNEKARKEAEERRKHEEAAAAAARANQPPPEPLPTPVASAPIKPAYGRATRAKLVKVARVTDALAVAKHFIAHPDMAALLAKLAQREVDAGNAVPGIEIDEQRKVA